MKYRKRLQYREIGFLIIRIGLGIMLILHGYPKMFGGPETWVELGSVMGYLGITFSLGLWGFIASFAQFFGGIFLILGLFFSPTLLLLIITMSVATFYNITMSEGFNVVSHTIELVIVFLALLFTGPGRFSIDEALLTKRR